MSSFRKNHVTSNVRPDTNKSLVPSKLQTDSTMKNFLALLTVSTIALCGTCDAFQGQGGRDRDRQGPPGGGQRGPRGGEQMMPPIIKALDTDGDGAISSAEMANAAASLATLDQNGDGVLEIGEMMPPRPERGGRGGRGGPGGPGGERGGGANGFIERVMQNDADGDGKVSLAEAPERMQGFFERLDGNNDGFLTPEELTEASRNWQGGGGGRRGGGGGEGQRPRRPGSE